MLVGITDEPFGSPVGCNELEPWQLKALMELRLDGPGVDRNVHLGGDSRGGNLPVRYIARVSYPYDRIPCAVF